jgi:hypothetical protein
VDQFRTPITESGESILRSLQAVATEREARAKDPALGARVVAIKAFQHARFAHTYADLMVDARYAGATRFFLEDLYGPADFTQRDAEFARIVPALVRLFPQDIVGTVADLSALHALSERLDTAMALRVVALPMDSRAYSDAWRLVGDAAGREQQVQLILAVGSALDRFTRKLLLRNTLRMMRGPAAAAGLGTLQRFLETGFDTFKAMGGAREFLDTVSARERALSAHLFNGCDVATPPGF